MFERFEEAYKLLTSRFWREALRKFARIEAVKESQLYGTIAIDENFKRDYAAEVQVDRAKVVQYIQAALTDSLEYLVEKKVLFQVHRWRCQFCGHNNAKSIDDIKKENECSICRTKYFAPVDISWSFKFNSFVTESLADRNGLTVLWTLGYLHDVLFRGSFYYLPEANLFFKENEEERWEEIDILSVCNGKLFVGEVKKTATSFLRKDGDIAKFITKLKSLDPDIALLVFENLAEDIAENDQVKVEMDNAKSTILRETGLDPRALIIIVASETQGFNKYGHDFGFIGRRLSKIIFRE